MSSVVISGDTSGAITVAAPAVAGTNTITLPAVTGTAVIAGKNSAITAATAQTASSTAVDFTGIPSWVKRITVMLSGVSTSGTSALVVQIGDAGGFEITGYSDTVGAIATSTASVASTAGTGFSIATFSANTDAASGSVVLNLISSNTWTLAGVIRCNNSRVCYAGGSKGLSDTLDRVRITIANGTDTFDAGTINILYE
jgi:hypothetical protein